MIHNAKGDLLTQSECAVICHQTNCVSHNTTRVSGIAKSIAEKWPDLHPYRFRKTESELGSIRIARADSQKWIIELNAQFYPGPARFGKDSEAQRQDAFERCLKKVYDAGIRKLAFPKFIGCGLASGDWVTYRKMIEDVFGGDDCECWIFEFQP